MIADVEFETPQPTYVLEMPILLLAFKLNS
jgi:hypothetical protein